MEHMGIRHTFPCKNKNRKSNEYHNWHLEWAQPILEHLGNLSYEFDFVIFDKSCLVCQSYPVWFHNINKSFTKSTVSANHNRVHDISQVPFTHKNKTYSTAPINTRDHSQIQVSNMHLGEGGLNMETSKPFPTSGKSRSRNTQPEGHGSTVPTTRGASLNCTKWWKNIWEDFMWEKLWGGSL